MKILLFLCYLIGLILLHFISTFLLAILGGSNDDPHETDDDSDSYDFAVLFLPPLLDTIYFALVFSIFPF